MFMCGDNGERGFSGIVTYATVTTNYTVMIEQYRDGKGVRRLSLYEPYDFRCRADRIREGIRVGCCCRRDMRVREADMEEEVSAPNASILLEDPLDQGKLDKFYIQFYKGPDGEPIKITTYYNQTGVSFFERERDFVSHFFEVRPFFTFHEALTNNIPILGTISGGDNSYHCQHDRHNQQTYICFYHRIGNLRKDFPMVFQ